MHRFKKLVILTAAVFGFTASVPSLAHYQHYRGPRVGVYVGAPWYGPAFYPPPVYYPPYPYGAVVVVPSTPATYVERVIVEPQTATANPSTPSAPMQTQWWYYCKDSQSYYPQVQQCSSPWQLVAPQPQPQPQQ